MTEDNCDPPFRTTYKSLLDLTSSDVNHRSPPPVKDDDVDDDIPLIDLSLLDHWDFPERDLCKKGIVDASSEWGFFQVINHGLPDDLIQRICREQRNVFRRPFEKKLNEKLLSDFSPDTYRWGAPSATSIHQLSWSEAYHLPLSLLSSQPIQPNSLREVLVEFTCATSTLAHLLAGVLSDHLGYRGRYFEEKCTQDSCYLRLNRYPPCSAATNVNGMIPHTDSDFLTILYQDQVGGLQVMKDGRWIPVRPNPDALIINIGDLFQAWSDGEYKSVEHRVASNPKVERFSMAYFFCPEYDAVIESSRRLAPPVYRRFSFREYRQRVQEDVKLKGYKVGLSRFLNVLN